MNSTTTSAAHISTATEAIAKLVSKYEQLDGRMTLPAGGRRTTALERVTAATFSTVTHELAPYGIDDLDEEVPKRPWRTRSSSPT